MKKLIALVMIFSVLFVGCSSQAPEQEIEKKTELEKKEEIVQKDVVVYFAKGKEWAASYTLFDGGETMFDSLYIQNIGDREAEQKPIEYVFEGNGIKSESQYPLELQGVRSLQVSSEYNKELIKINRNDKEYKLTIKQDGTSEELTLRLINNARSRE